MRRARGGANDEQSPVPTLQNECQLLCDCIACENDAEAIASGGGVVEPDALSSAQFYELADLFARQADAIAQPYAWPPRVPMTAEEVAEVELPTVTSRRIAYRAAAHSLPPRVDGKGLL